MDLETDDVVAWLRLMGYNSSQSGDLNLTVDDIGYLLTSPLKRSLLFLVSNCRPEATVSRLREDHMLNRTAEEVQLELDEVMLSISTLEGEIETLSREVQELSTANSKYNNTICERSVKATMLNAYSQQLMLQSHMLSDYNQRIKGYLPDAGDSEGGERENHHSQCQDVASTITRLAGELHSINSGGSSDAHSHGKSIAPRIPKDSLPGVNQLSIYKELVASIGQATDRITKQCSSVNLDDEARSLCFIPSVSISGSGSGSGDGIAHHQYQYREDASKVQHPLDKVALLMERERQTQIDMYFEAQQMKNESVSLLESKPKPKPKPMGSGMDGVEVVDLDIDRENFNRSNTADSTHPKGGEGIIPSLEAEICALSSGIDTAKAILHRLHEEQEERQRRRDLVRSKCLQISQFKEMTKEKQLKITRLFKMNRTVLRSMQPLRERVKSFCQKSVDDSFSVESNLMDLLTKMRGTARAEGEAFMALPLNDIQLKSVGMDGGASGQDDGGRNRKVLVRGQSPMDRMCVKSPLLDEAMGDVNLPPWSSPSILHHIIHSERNRQYELLKKSVTQEIVDEVLQGCASEMSTATEAVTAFTSREERHLDTHLPLLEKVINKLDAGIAKCNIVRDAFRVWVDQPGQYTAPWMKVDGLSLKEWVNEIVNLQNKLKAP